MSTSREIRIKAQCAAVKVLDVTVKFQITYNTPSTSDPIMALLNALPLQVHVTAIFELHVYGMSPL